MTADIRADLRAKIADGHYKPGDRLPTVRELMTAYGLRSRATLDRALRDLTAEGLLRPVHGSGIFVRGRETVARDLVAGLRMEHRRAVTGHDGGGLFEAMTGERAEVDVQYAEVPADERTAAILAMAAGDTVLERMFFYRVQGKPHQIARSYLPLATARAAGLKPEDEVPGAGTMAQLARAGIRVTRVALEVGARMPSAGERAELAMPPGTPLLDHRRTMYAGEQAAETGTAIVPADRVSYVFNVDLEEPHS